VELGANTLVGAEKGSIIKKAREELAHDKSTEVENAANPFGDGKASEKILRILKKWVV